MRAPAAFSDTTATPNDIEPWLPLADTIARRVLARVPPSVEIDDLRSEARLALLQAVKRFDPARGVPFGAYARRRISGAVLDFLRRIDPLSRRDRAAVTAGSLTWDEVSLDEARDAPAVAQSEARAADLAERRAEAMLADIADLTDQEIVRRLVVDEEAVERVAAELRLKVRAVERRKCRALRRLRASAQSATCC